MDFTLSEEQQLLKSTARDFLHKECPASLVREMERDEKGYPPRLWRRMAEMGWQGLVFPAAYGGSGKGFLDLVVLIEEMGRVCLPGPFFSTVVLAGLPVLRSGNEEQRRGLLPGICSGDLVATFALTEPGGGYDARDVRLSAARDGSAFRLEGVKLFVPDARAADYMIVAARTKSGAGGRGGITLFLVGREPGVLCAPLSTVAGDGQCEVVFDGVLVPAGTVLGKPDRGWPEATRTLQQAAVAACAQMVGGARRVLEMSVDYASSRVQFGRPIGSFQAIQHYCADMMIYVEAGAVISYKAAWLLGEGRPAAAEVSMAKGWVGTACERVASLGQQIHGAVGFMEDHDMQLYFRRAKAGEIFFGDGDHHREKVAQLLEI